MPETRPCENCGAEMLGCYTEVGEGRVLLRHWYCPKCHHDTRAIGRERMMEPKLNDPE